MHGLPLPEKIANAPELLLGLDVFYNAFLDLTSCRVQGFGEGPITWLSIAEYADRQGFEGEQRDDLFYHISNLDAAYLEFKASKLKSKTKNGK